MSDIWYCQFEQRCCGPFTLEELRYLATRGRLSPQDLVRPAVDAPWMPAKSVDGLFGPPASRQIEIQQTAVVSARPLETTPTAQLEQPKDQPQPSETAPTSQPAAILPLSPPPFSQNARLKRSILIGSGIGIVVILLIFAILLWLLSTGSGMLAGNEVGSGGGETGTGTGTGSGAGEEDTGNGPPTDGPAPESPSPGSPHADATNTPSDDQPQPPGNPPTELPPPDSDKPDPTSLTIARIPAASVESSNDKLGSGGRGGSGGDGKAGGASGGRRQSDVSEFFGVKSKGRRFVYVVDCSGSMSGPPFMKACDELMDSIKRLNSQQSFYVIFFSHQSYPMYYPASEEPNMLPASRKNRNQVQQWVNDFAGGGGTDPQDAMLRALALKPDAIFLLTDGQFDASVTDVIVQTNKSRVVINTIAFINPTGEPLLKKIARQNRGEYRFVP